MDDQIARHIELLHQYRLDLWNEVEAQLRVIHGSQAQIEKLRNARVEGESVDEARQAAEVLARHVQTLKGRISALGGTVNELDGTVGELLKVLSRQ
jgi:hypothetical protein